jgi:outer membrane lipopolysaccharide assembly protein LptE/RlpB
MMKSHVKIFFILVITIITSCGFKILDKGQLLNLKIKDIKISGDKKTAFLIKNNIQKILKENQGNREIVLDIKTEKTKKIKEKNLKNQITKYEITLNTNVAIEFMSSGNNKEFLISVNGNYDIADSHTSTINNQNNLEKNLSNTSTDQIINYLILKMNE